MKTTREQDENFAKTGSILSEEEKEAMKKMAEKAGFKLPIFKEDVKKGEDPTKDLKTQKPYSSDGSAYDYKADQEDRLTKLAKEEEKLAKIAKEVGAESSAIFENTDTARQIIHARARMRNAKEKEAKEGPKKRKKIADIFKKAGMSDDDIAKAKESISETAKETSEKLEETSKQFDEVKNPFSAFDSSDVDETIAQSRFTLSRERLGEGLMTSDDIEGAVDEEIRRSEDIFGGINNSNNNVARENILTGRDRSSSMRRTEERRGVGRKVRKEAEYIDGPEDIVVDKISMGYFGDMDISKMSDEELDAIEDIFMDNIQNVIYEYAREEIDFDLAREDYLDMLEDDLELMKKEAKMMDGELGDTGWTLSAIIQAKEKIKKQEDEIRRERAKLEEELLEKELELREMKEKAKAEKERRENMTLSEKIIQYMKDKAKSSKEFAKRMGERAKYFLKEAAEGMVMTWLHEVGMNLMLKLKRVVADASISFLDKFTKKVADGFSNFAKGIFGRRKKPGFA